jgi:hypothetical protein
MQLILIGTLLAALSLAYFYVDYFFSTDMTPIFAYLLIVQDSNTAWLSFAVCVAAAFWRFTWPASKAMELLGSHERFASLTCIFLLTLTAIMVYKNTAFSMDEYAAVFQAKVFAAGHLTGKWPPSVIDWLVPPGFNGAFLVASRLSGNTIEAYWPGFALLLAPFELLNVPWLCNPCLAGASLYLIHRITLELSGDRNRAGWAVLFAFASGAFIANAISFYSMQAHLTLNLLYAWLLLKPSPKRAFAAGVVGSFALVLHNPFPHTIFAAPWIIALARSTRGPAAFFSLALGYLPILMILGFGWMQLRSTLVDGHADHNLVVSLMSAVFSWPDKSMINTRVAAAAKMWIWAVPCLFVFAAVGIYRRRDDGRTWLLALSAILTFVGYVFVIFDQGHGWGYRYFHSAWGVIPVLAGCAMPARDQPTNRLAAFAGMAAILNLSIVVPFQLTQMDDVISSHSSELPPPKRPGRDVYFVKPSGKFYVADLIQSDPFLRGTDLILMSRGTDLDAELRRRNWPNAVLVEKTYGVEEWNIGESAGPMVFSFLPQP